MTTAAFLGARCTSHIGTSKKTAVRTIFGLPSRLNDKGISSKYIKYKHFLIKIEFFKLCGSKPETARSFACTVAPLRLVWQAYEQAKLIVSNY